MKVCIVVPIYNEAAIARESIEVILQYTRRLPPVVTLVVVNDGSKDDTVSKIREAAGGLDENEFVLISHPVNKGYGAALRTGMLYAFESGYDYALFMDSDLTNHPKYLKDFYDKMIEGWDYIKATRYSKGGSVEGVPLKRYLISKYGNLFARIVTGLPLTDITNGFRAVKVDILRQLNLTENHFSIIVEEIMKASKITDSFCEIPNILGTRDKTARPTKFTYDPKTFWKYFKYLFI